MKKWLLDKEVKNRLLDLMTQASQAHRASLATEKRGSQEDRSAAKAKANEALEKLRQELKSAGVMEDVGRVRELATHAQYEATHRPIVPIGRGESRWDKKVAASLQHVLRSLQSAIVEEFGGDYEKAKDEPRIKVVKTRAFSTELFVELYNELDGEAPRNGMTRGAVEFGLKKLNSKVEALMKSGKSEDAAAARRLNDQYGRTERGFSFLLKQRSESQTGSFRLGQTVNPADEE